MISKEKLFDNFKNIPEEKFKHLDDVQKEFTLKDKIENSLEAAAKEDIVTEEEMDKLVDTW